MMRILSALAVAAVCAVGSAFAQTPPPVEAFGRLPALVDVAISPDGTKLALARAEGLRSHVQIFDIQNNTMLTTVDVDDEGGVRLRGVGWADDERATFLISRSVRPSEVLPEFIRFRGAPRQLDYFRNGVINLTTQRIELISTSENFAWADGGGALYAHVEGDPGFGRLVAPAARGLSVYRVDLDSGRTRPSTPNGVSDETIRILLNRRGEVVARADSNRRTNHWRVFTYDGEAPRLLLEGTSDTGAAIALQGLLPDGRLAAIDPDDAGAFEVLYAIDRQTAAREVLFQRAGYDIDDAIVDPWRREVVGVSWTEDEHLQHFFDPALQAIYEEVRAAFTTGSATLMTWSRDRSRVVVYGEQGLDGGAFYLFTPSQHQIQRLAPLYPELEGARRGERQAISYAARDGVRIPAYLTLPAGRGAPGLPLVLLVHGGPASRDSMDYDYWAAFLASRGYAVLQPNFRGSSGYGSAWERAGHRQWGGLMQTDVEDGVVALARAGTIDASRVCIVGGSYGGYAALAGASLTPDRYRCAASVNGVSDLGEFLRQRIALTGADSGTSDYWRISIGDRDEDAAAVRAASPALLAAHISAPVLLIHSTDDSVVPIDQSRRMQRALSAAGRNVRFVELRGDDHYLSAAETRIQTLREIEAFLAQHNPAGP